MPGHFEIEVNEKWCKGCGLCVDLCPGKVFVLKDNLAKSLIPESSADCSLYEYRCPDLVFVDREKVLVCKVAVENMEMIGNLVSFM